MKKKIILAVAIIALAGGIYVYSEYNRKVKGLSEVKADHGITAEELIAAFEKDSATANQNYLGKIIEVSGTVQSIEKNEASATIVLGKDGSMSAVRCSMDPGYYDQVANVQEGQTIVIRGNCTGFNADDLLGSDVILNRSVIVNNQISIYKN